MKAIRKWINRYDYQIIAFIIAFVPRVILNLYALPLRTQSDELATMSGGAYLAGLDWTNVVSQAGYYGFGFTALLAPLFRLIQDPILLYRSILIVESLMHASIALIAYYLLKRYYHLENKNVLLWVSVACSYMVVTRTMIVYNEHMLILCSWLVLLLFCKLIEYQNHKKKHIIYSILLMLLLSYSLTLHSRAVMYLFVFVLVYSFYLIWFHKKITSAIPTIITMVMGFLGSKVLIKWMQNQIWMVESGSEVRNGSVKLSLSQQILDAVNMHSWINIIMGQLNSVALISGGLLIVGMILFFYVAGKLIRKKTASSGSEEQLLQDYYAIPILFFGLCIGLTIGAQSIIWLARCSEGMLLGFGSSGYGLKAVTYVRYMGPFLGPMLMLVLAYAFQNKEQFAKFYRIAYGCIWGLVIFWTTCILPYVYTNRNVIEIYLPFSFSTRHHVEVGRMTFLPGLMILLLLATLYWFWLSKDKVKRIAIVTAVFLAYQYCYNALAYDYESQAINYEEINQTCDFLQKLEETGALPEEIYVVDFSDRSDHQTYFALQFHLKNTKIISGYPDANTENAIVCINSNTCPYDLMQDNSYQYVRVDRGEYIWIKGEELQSACRQLNAELEVPNVYLEANQVISFSNRYENGKILQSGWYAQEIWGSWSKGAEAELFFILPEEQRKGCTVNIRMQCYQSIRNVTVTLNDSWSTTLEVTGVPGNYQIQIPEEIADDGRIRMKIHVDGDLYSPVAIGQSEDTRVLGVGLYSIRVE